MVNIYNKSALNALPSAQKSGARFEAVLLEFDLNGNQEKPAWRFLINPKELQFSQTAQYSKVSTIASSVADRQFTGGTGATLKITDMVMDTFCHGKSLRPLIEGAQALMRARIDKNEFQPPVLAFKVGSRRFAPCVLISLDWVESRSLSGEPARVVMAMTLEEIPRPLTKAEQEVKERLKQDTIADRRESDGKPRRELTFRQITDSTLAAKKYLQDNKSVFTGEIQGIISRNLYFTKVDKNTGDVTILSGDSALGIVGRSLGDKLIANDTVSTLPLKPNTKRPILK